MSDYQPRSVAEVMVMLDKAAAGVQKAATRLMRLTQSFHEAREGEGGVELGTALAFDIAVKDELASIYNDAIQADRRPPAEDIREAMAHRAVQAKQPELWARYHAEKAEISALQSWISNQKAAISANQSILRGERE